MERGHVVSIPTALVVGAPGTNRDADVAFALELAGARCRRVMPGELGADHSPLDSSQLLVLAGGFSYGDNTGAGRLFGLEIDSLAGDSIRRFISHGRPVLGICNGFQALVRAGLLPGAPGAVALGHNDSGSFDCRWVRIQPVSARSVWTRGLIEDIDCPIAHGEGRFTCSTETLAALEQSDSIAFRYAGSNPNGSAGAVAGICDPSGVVLGLMPHPENHVLQRQNPLAARGERGGLGLALFRAGVDHARSC